MNRFKNYALWVAMAALGGMIVQDLGFNITPEKYESYVNSILYILAISGVINNPSLGKGFKDNKKDK